MNKVEELLDGALDVLYKHGWTQEVLHDRETGAVCARGALLVAAGAPLDRGWVFAYRTQCGPEVGIADGLLCDIAVEQFADRVPEGRLNVGLRSEIVYLNDNPKTTFDDIVVVFEKARVKAREKL